MLRCLHCLLSRYPLVVLLALHLIGTPTSLLLAADDVAAPPIRALLITGGCCHDYDVQKQLIANGLKERANIEVTVVQQGGTATDSKIALYQDPDWAEGYDVVLHDECFAAVKDPAWTQRVLKPHQNGVPAVVIHCAMHCYRDGTDNWFEFCGVTSHTHGSHYGHEVLNRDATHDIMKDFGPAWMNPKGELYEIAKLWPTAHPLASSKNREQGNEEVCVWTNDYHGTRVFGTTLGHHNETVSSPEFLDLLTRGTLWACDKLSAEYLNAKEPAQEPDGDTAPQQESEAELLADVQYPSGFEATVFAAPPAVKYPVFVAAAEDGTLFVAVDQNGSLDRELKRGSIYRLRDHDGDGRADEVKLFVADVDSPRGMVWDHDRLYVMHPPHLSAFIDQDGDGIADQQQSLVKNIAFGFEDRPADHTSNGVTLGVDGWLYLAIGDFGFMKATGADGRELQFRSGGVIRVRPDGSEMEVYATGTRNILEVAMDPLLNGFTRDNTNDGGGWDIRLHHFSGMEDHGYPRLYMNFGDEIIQPLADYGGGSGCGALYMDEPGFPAGMGDALYTADWGRQQVFRHTLSRGGATFAATQDPFVTLPRVTDLDVDANSTLYLSSWKGASFRYVGDDVGFIVQLKPEGYQPAPLPDYDAIDRDELVAELRSPSHRRRLAASRAIVRRELTSSTNALWELCRDETADTRHRVAALFTIKQLLGHGAHQGIAKLVDDPAMQPFAIRALGDRASQPNDVDDQVLLDGLKSAQPRARLEAAVAIARLGKTQLAAGLVPLLRDDDDVVSHTARQALVLLNAFEACLAELDAADADYAVAILKALQVMHHDRVVDELISRSGELPTQRMALLMALCRLYNVEGEWQGNSWGTRPDTRGPYFQPEPWSASPRIAEHLGKVLSESELDFGLQLVRQLNRHRVALPETDRWLLDAAVRNPSAAMPDLLRHLASKTAIDESTADIVLNLVGQESFAKEMRVEAVPVLLRLKGREAIAKLLDWMSDGDSKLQRQVLQQRGLRRKLDELIEFAQSSDPRSAAALTALAALQRGRLNEEAKTQITAIMETVWDADRLKYLTAVQTANRKDLSNKVLLGLQDGSEQVRNLAAKLAADWKLDKLEVATGPKISSLTPESVLAEAIEHRGSAEQGRLLFERLECNKCHTVKSGEALRGPYLPNVAKTYKRSQLAEAVLLPNKTIAQGFVTNVFVLDDGRQIIGFVTNEGATELTIRDNQGAEMKIPVESIEDRTTQTVSVMPEGLLKNVTTSEFGSLLSYLESLASEAKGD